ncbi:hypothetical protein EW145_g247 [Phellinidium pouzarii]|uniref:Uncharacterized protein n=1 Tax=Phellinidium pouzarii TaxID=167371 RepID=A0A4S4LL09_9AGAM|nr:hypothetical protein EW145_g247 [Phellinidium pouzarii]
MLFPHFLDKHSHFNGRKLHITSTELRPSSRLLTPQGKDLKLLPSMSVSCPLLSDVSHLIHMTRITAAASTSQSQNLIDHGQSRRRRRLDVLGQVQSAEWSSIDNSNDPPVDDDSDEIDCFTTMADFPSNVEFKKDVHESDIFIQPVEETRTHITGQLATLPLPKEQSNGELLVLGKPLESFGFTIVQQFIEDQSSLVI